MFTRIGIILALATTLARADTLTPTLTLDRPVVALGAEATVHLLVRFEVPEAAPADAALRPPVHLALVIDRSGSMDAAGKITYAKAAAKSLVSLLRRKDRLAIVEYDDRVTVLWPSAPVADAALVERLIDGLTPRGSTDLAAGLSAGLAEIDRDRQPGLTCRTILLSDGQANAGITNVGEIAAIAAAGRRSGVAVTTMGLGLSYNEDLMQAVAAGGGGRYYYIENPAAMARIYEAEMGKVLQQTTRDIALWFEPGPAVAEVVVYGYPSETSGRQTRITMEDLYGGDSRSVLIGLRLASVGEGELAVGRLGLRYTDVADGRERSQLMPVSVRGSADAALVARSVNAGAATEAVLVVTDGRHDQAVRAFESGDKAGALAALDTLRREVAAAHVQFKDPKLAKKLEALDLERADMDRAEHDPQYRAGYLKRSKEAFYSSTRGKRDKYLLDDGANGLDVENLQRKLAASGHYAGAIDGRYDADVHDAVAAFQRANNLVVDGIAGPRTLRALGLF